MLSETDLYREFAGARFLIVPGHYDFFGGAERQALILAKALTEQVGCHVDFLGWGGHGILAERVRELGLKPWVFALPNAENRVAMAFALVKLARFIKREIKPDYLLPFVSYHSKVIGSIWRHTGARFTWWNQRDEGRGVHGTRTEQRLMRTLPSIVSNSYEGREFLVRKFNLSLERVRIINNGIELPAPGLNTGWREWLKLDSDDVLITMVANLTQFKDHDTLLRAFAQVRAVDIGKKCLLVLAGRHDERSVQLKALAFDLGLGDSVRMPGHIEDVDGLLAATDLVVHSSNYEGCPNSVLEAMAHGRCVVGTDISGMRQALGEEAAEYALARPGDAEHLSRLITGLASSKTTRVKRGLENRRRIEQEFSVSQMCTNVLETVYECRLG